MPNISSPSLHPIQTKQPTLQPQPQSQQTQKFYQPHGSQLLSPSSTSAPSNFPPSSVKTPPLQCTTAQQTTIQPPPPALPTIQQTTTSTQQSTQCQTDPPDVKPNIHLLSPIKQELPSPIQVQVQTGSPAGQVASPRVAGKAQRIQSPVNVAVSPGAKQLVSPVSGAGPMVSPRQGVKRPATSPICRQINRSDL